MLEKYKVNKFVSGKNELPLFTTITVIREDDESDSELSFKIMKELNEEGLKQKRLLEILKKKKVNIFDEIYQCTDYQDYLDNFSYAQNLYNLTEEEFNLVKEWLERD